MIFTHKIALDLTHEQEAYCRRAAGAARYTYNWALAEWKRQYGAGEKPTAAQLKAQWNAVKYERYPWLADIHRDAHAHPFTNLAAAFVRFFRHDAGYPTFKKKGKHDSFYVANDKCTVRGKRIRLPRLGWVRMRETLRFTGKLMSGVVSRTADRWFPSSKLCSRCGVVVETLPLSQRMLQCGACGYTADRDLNAALNLANHPGLQGK